MNTVLETIKKRRSVRAYKEEQLKQEELDLIIEAGIYAPSAHNDQPWYFTVIQDRERIFDINNKTKALMVNSGIQWIEKMGANPNLDITYKAPTLIIVSGKKDAIAPTTDCAIALQNMLVAAESLDIGSVWMGFLTLYFTLEEEVSKLGLPEGYEPCYAAVFGYKALDRVQAAPKRKTDVVNYIR